MSSSIATTWRQLSGQDHWNNMLDPLDIDLRRYILHYGDLSEVTYDTFNNEKTSKFCGSSRYGKADLFKKVGLVKNHPLVKYTVTKYFYATSTLPVPDAFLMKSFSREAWCKESNWIGYVAVATDEGVKVLGRREILVVWRGTIGTLEWINDLEFGLVSADKLLGTSGNPMVHKGWLSIYMSDDRKSPYNKASARDQVLPEVQRLVEKFQNEETSISVCGHSMGASLATLNAADIVASGITKPKVGCATPILVTAFVFACPRIGDPNFKHVCSNMKDLRVLRIFNALDVVPNYPFIGYSDIGEGLRIDTTQSPFLKSPGSITSWHKLEAYLHGIAGTQGSKGGFKLEVDRDISLANKTYDVLKNEYLVPAQWWCEKNRGMVQQENGSWKLNDHEENMDQSYLNN
ncbi:hypothetical protein IFM89_016476 [Coptis chinensis]|uniref:Phospholipase A1 n=1 Tax=Coptis chinensis TaxID=261450 RepID=A0A835I4I6_9MAGN|nr:hypothetical protein IFM89_016476 [Coptis chinensis]